MAWDLFSNIVTGCANSVISNRTIVDRIQAHQPLHVDAVLPPSMKPKVKEPSPKPAPGPRMERVSVSPVAPVKEGGND